MSPLEQAIRNALERADRANPDIRARIYQSARNALENGLRKQEITDPDVIHRQRERLEETIRAIENEEAERLAAMARLEKLMIEQGPDPDDVPSDAPGAAPDITPDVRPDDRPGGRFEPVSRPPSPAGVAPPVVATPVAAAAAAVAPGVASPVIAHATRAEPVLDAAHREEERLIAELAAGPANAAPSAHEEEDPAWAPEGTPAAARVTSVRRSRIRRAGSAIIALFVYSVLLGGLGFGGWWVWQTGLLQTLAERSGDVSGIIVEVQSDDYDPSKSPLDPQQSFSGDWISIFKPGEGTVVPGPKATVEDVSDSDGKAVRIVSAMPSAEGEVRVTIPAAALADLGGKTVIFALTVKSDGKQTTEVYVECDFGTLGNCGRHRYTVVQDRADQLFKLNFANKLAPSQDGTIIINSDVTGGNRAVRLYGVRVLPGG